MPWVRKPFPTIPGYESKGDSVEAKRWVDFKINELLDTGDPVWEYRDELKSIKDICEFVIKEFDYPLRWGTPTDVHRNNWFSGLCCHQITLDYWQTASETLRTLRLNRLKGKKGYGDCEDTSVLFVTLMEEKCHEAYECLGLVYRGDELLGGHGYAIFMDEVGVWRLYESTLDVPPPYPDGYPAIGPGANEWKVGDLRYVAWVKFNRREYYEWVEEGEKSMISLYLNLTGRMKERRRKYEEIAKAWGLPVKPLRRLGLLGRLRWR